MSFRGVAALQRTHCTNPPSTKLQVALHDTLDDLIAGHRSKLGFVFQNKYAGLEEMAETAKLPNLNSKAQGHAIELEWTSIG